MNKYLFIFSLIFILNACQSKCKTTDNEIFTYLKICFEDYYLNYDVEVTPLLNEFEFFLVREGPLSDTSGKAYKSLFKALDSSDYFDHPLKMEDFNNALLYKNPSTIFECATTVFSVDSTSILNTKFSKITQEISEYISNNETISIHYFFDLYHNKLTDEEIRMPYIKQSILILLYRWYFKSKYDREIQIYQ